MATNIERIKWVEGTPFLVDGFAFASPSKCQHYFLTHFHSDHTWGLKSSFSAGTIYCSEVTAALVVGKMGVQPQFVRALPLHKPTFIEGVEVTLLDANHCPGAVQFLFRIPQSQSQQGNNGGNSKKRPLHATTTSGGGAGDDGGYTTVLHTGDCRASGEMIAAAVKWLEGLKATEERAVLSSPAGRGKEGKKGQGQGRALVDVVYLDTTYCDPKPQALAEMARIAQREKEADPRTVFYVGCYSIGKERAVRAVAEAVGSKVYADERKERVLRLAGEWDDALFSKESGECSVRMSWLGRLRPDRMRRERKGDGGKEEGGVKEEEEEEEEVRWEAVNEEEEEEAEGEGQEQQEQEEEQQGKGGRVVGFRPTGWCYTRNAIKQYQPWVDDSGRTRLYCVPYSEHSSFPELQAYVKALKPRRIIPTVNAADNGKVEKMLRHFFKDMDLSHDKARLDAYFSSRKASKATSTSTSSSIAAAAVVVSTSSSSVHSSTNASATVAAVAVKSTSSTASISTTAAAAAAAVAVKSQTGGGSSSFFTTGKKARRVDLAAVDVEEQRRLWRAAAGKGGGGEEEEEEEEGGDCGAAALGEGWERVESSQDRETGGKGEKVSPVVITIDDSDGE